MAKNYQDYTSSEKAAAFSSRHPSPCNACSIVAGDQQDHRASDASRWARAEEYYRKIDALIASSVNKTTDGQTAVDVTALVQSADGWTVDAERGGVVKLIVKNQNYSSGVYWINGNVRDFSSGLYTENTTVEYDEEVSVGDVVRSKDMQEVWFTPYRAIV